MKVLICDDEQYCIDSLKEMTKEYLQNRNISFSVDTFTSPTDVMNSGTAYDLVLLDIEMPDFSGTEIATELKRRNEKTAIFFVTSYSEYLDEAMNLRAFRFFEKPVKKERLYSGLDKAMEYIDQSYTEFYIRTDSSCFRILTDDILYVERSNRAVTLVTKQGNFTTKESFDDWSEKLKLSYFYRVHKSYIVNLHYITQYSGNELVLSNRILIPIAQKRQADFRKFWFEYISRR